MRFTANCATVIGMIFGSVLLFYCSMNWLAYFNDEAWIKKPMELANTAAFTLFGLLSIPAGLTILFRSNRSYLFFLMEWAVTVGLAINFSWSWVPILMLIPHGVAIILRVIEADIRNPDTMGFIRVSCAIFGMTVPPIMLFVRLWPVLSVVVVGKNVLEIVAAILYSLILVATGLSLRSRSRASYWWFAVQVAAAVTACVSMIFGMFWFTALLIVFPHAVALALYHDEVWMERRPLH